MAEPAATNPREPSEKELAGLCVGGQVTAGIELCCRLHARGEAPTIDALVRLAVPTGRPTPTAFDHLADACHRWGATS